MDCRRHNNALNEVAAGGPATAALDAHLGGCADCRSRLARLRQLLSIAEEQVQALVATEPSAAFMPRLRVAVTESASVPAWRWSWWWPSLATAATLFAAFAVLMLLRPYQHPIEAATSHAQSAVPPVPARAPDSIEVAAVPSEVRPPPRRRVSRPITAGPEVLVPPGEARAVAELIALVNHHQLAPAALISTGEPIAPLAAPLPIHIKPIEIVPLDPVISPGT